MSGVILGCGDVGRRIAKQLIESGASPSSISAYVNSASSLMLAQQLHLDVHQINLDKEVRDLNACDNAQLYYTVAPQKSGEQDLRSESLLNAFNDHGITPEKVVLISTTGVYGDCDGEWVNEQSTAVPQTSRGKRRLNAEQQWLTWGRQRSVPVVVLRVPGIYAYSRLPRERLKKGTPVVVADQCGYSNRIHADDLAHVSCVAMQRGQAQQIFNATDGTPGKITEYLQAAAQVLGLEPLPEISMQQAQTELSEGMLSYLGESRKISNQKMLDLLSIKLRYPDFKEGIKH